MSRRCTNLRNRLLNLWSTLAQPAGIMFLQVTVCTFHNTGHRVTDK